MSNVYLRKSDQAQIYYRERNPPIQREQQNPQPQKRRRNVHFSPSQNSIHYLRDVPPSSVMTDEERKSVWYTYADMEEMRTAAKKIARRLIMGGEEALGSGSDDSVLATTKTKGMDRCDSKISGGQKNQQQQQQHHHHPQHLVRGLEFFLSPTRQFNRLLTIQTILESQRRNIITIEEALASSNTKNEERRRLWYEVAGMRLGCVSQRCSHVARDLALVTGLNDFHGVYGKDLYEMMVNVDRKSKERTDMKMSLTKQRQQQQQQQHFDRVAPLGFSPRRGLPCGKKRGRMQHQQDLVDIACGEIITMERCSKRRYLIK